MIVKKEYRLLSLQEVSVAYTKTLTYLGFKSIEKKTSNTSVSLVAHAKEAKITIQMKERLAIPPRMKHLGEVPAVTLEMRIESSKAGARREEEIGEQIENGLWLYLPGHGG